MAAVLVLDQFYRGSRAVTAIEASNQLLSSLETVHHQVTRGESHVRSYVLTRDSTFLEALARSDSLARGAMAQLDNAAARIPGEARAIGELRPLVEHKLALMGAQSGRGPTRLGDAAAIDSIAVGRAVMDSIDARAAEIERTQTARVARFLAEERRTAATTGIVALLLVLFAAATAVRGFASARSAKTLIASSLDRVEQERKALWSVLDALPVGVFIADEVGTLTYSNKASVTIWGGQAPLVGADRYAEYKGWWPSTGTRLESKDWGLARSLTGSETVVAEAVDIERFDGLRGHILNSAAPIRDGDGKVVGAVAVILDITAQEEIERDRKRLTEELERSNAELQRFAYVASHDLQEPLRQVASYTQLLAKRYQGRLDADADEFIAFAVDGARRMQKLIQDLLEYSRIASGPLEREEVDTGKLLDGALSNLRVAIAEAGAVITRGYLPVVYGSSAQLGQVFQNLVANALKFRGRKNAEVFVGCRDDGDKWVFEVRDRGIGLDQKYSEKIFQVFQRLNAGSDYSGTGIGLSTCKKVVEKHGGTIWVTSTENGGATFSFTLPKE